MVDFSPGVKKLWNEWDLRTFVLISLLLQVILIGGGSSRKRFRAKKGKFFKLILWLAYLLADWVAIFALGILSNSRDNSDFEGKGKAKAKGGNNPNDRTDELRAFWAPFLLLHLGGPDSITAFALEDNELWLRHLLGLLFQVGVAVYVFIRSIPGTRLLAPAILMFVAGIVKYGERTYALMSASMDNLRDSMITEPDPGPNYAKFMEEYASKLNAKIDVEIVVEPEPESRFANLDTKEKDFPSEDEILSKARELFFTFRRLVVDLILSFKDRNESRSFFLTRKPLDAFKVVELELEFVYEVLYTKAVVIHTIVGCLLRITSFSSTLSACMVFLHLEKGGYSRLDIIVTYTLLGAALFLEVYAFRLLVISDWSFVKLKKCGGVLKLLSEIIYRFRPIERARWSNYMAQFNLIRFSLANQPSMRKKFLKFICLKDLWDKFRYTKHQEVDNNLKKFIFKELKKKSSSAEDSRSFKRFSNCRGEWALQRNGYRKEFGWSIEVEFDESILLWHIATDICFHQDTKNKDQPETQADLSKNSIKLSDYMLYLLVVRPFMLTAGIGQIRYGDTCAEATKFFQRGQREPDDFLACEMLLYVNTTVLPKYVKGDRSKSVLFDAVRLARDLLKLESPIKRWQIISVVWVEMLSYAATNCRGFYHAQRLSAGGELLTFVWFLTAHLGIGNQYRIEEGHARAKLIVEK